MIHTTYAFWFSIPGGAATCLFSPYTSSFVGRLLLDFAIN
jgi:hypothetical protein